jgi:hypothetical protein
MKNDPTFKFAAAIIFAGVVVAFVNVASMPAAPSPAVTPSINATAFAQVSPQVTAEPTPAASLPRTHRHKDKKS